MTASLSSRPSIDDRSASSSTRRVRRASTAQHHGGRHLGRTPTIMHTPCRARTASGVALSSAFFDQTDESTAAGAEFVPRASMSGSERATPTASRAQRRQRQRRRLERSSRRPLRLRRLHGEHCSAHRECCAETPPARTVRAALAAVSQCRVSLPAASAVRRQRRRQQGLWLTSRSCPTDAFEFVHAEDRRHFHPR